MGCTSNDMGATVGVAVGSRVGDTTGLGVIVGSTVASRTAVVLPLPLPAAATATISAKSAALPNAGPFNLQGRFQKSLSNTKGREIILRNGTGSANPLLERAHYTPLRLGGEGVNGELTT